MASTGRGNHDCSVGITTSYVLDGSEFETQQRLIFFLSSLKITQAGFEVRTSSYKIVTALISLGVKWTERETNHSTPVSAEVKRSGSVFLLPLFDLVVWKWSNIDP